MIYYIIYSMLVIGYFLEIKGKIHPNEDYVFNCLLMLLFLFAALRGSGNGDYYNYLNGVRFIQSFEDLLFIQHYPFEFGFRFLSLLANKLELGPQFVIIMMNFISFGSIYLFFKDKEKSILSLIIFFPIMLQYDMHHSRSAVSMSLGLLFFDSFYKKHYLKSLLFFAIAMMFHRTALILIVIPPIIFLTKYLQFTWNKMFYISMLLIFTVILSIRFDLISVLILPLNNNLTSKLYFKLSSYLQNNRWSYPLKIYDPRIIMNILIYYYYFITETQDSEYETYLNTLHNIQLFSILLLIVFRTSTFIALRTHNYFNIFLIVTIPLFFKTKSITSLTFKNNALNLNNKNIRLMILLKKYSKHYILLMYIAYTLLIIYKQYEYRLFFH